MSLLFHQILKAVDLSGFQVGAPEHASIGTTRQALPKVLIQNLLLRDQFVTQQSHT
jgi:hypothetical protein